CVLITCPPGCRDAKCCVSTARLLIINNSCFEAVFKECALVCYLPAAHEKPGVLTFTRIRAREGGFGKPKKWRLVHKYCLLKPDSNSRARFGSCYSSNCLWSRGR